MKHSYFSNYFIICLPSFFLLLKLYLNCLLFNIINVYAYFLFLLYKDKSNFVYVLVHRNILMYNIYYLFM